MPSPTPRTREEVLAVAVPNGRYRTLREIGADLGVTYQRADQLLKKFDIVRPSRPPMYTCRVCNKRVGREGIVHRACGPPVKWMGLRCAVCKKKFKLKLWDWRIRVFYHRPNRKGTRTTPFFCSKPCFGLWFARHYGWQTKYPGEGSLYQRRKAAGVCAHPYKGCLMKPKQGCVFCENCAQIRREGRRNLYWRKKARGGVNGW